MHTDTDTDPRTAARAGEVTGIAAAMLPVTDLAVSAAFYRDLLGLRYVREFQDAAGTVTGCALIDPGHSYLISLRRRDTIAGGADLRGEHPIIVRVPDRETLARIRDRAAALGYAPTAGEHRDAAWLEVVDPDGIATRFAYPTVADVFFGVRAAGDGGFYDSPALTLPPARSA